MGTVVDYSTFSTLGLLRDSVKWFKANNKSGKFTDAIRVEEATYQEILSEARR